MLRRVAIGLAIGLAASVLAWTLGQAGVIQGFENQTYDLRVRWTAKPSDARPDIAVIEIDETSLRGLAPNFGNWPWPRFIHTGILDFLKRGHAKVVAYDVLFLEHDSRESFTIQQTSFTGAGSDDALVRSVRDAGNVVVLAESTYEGSDAPTGTASAAATPLPGPVYQPGDGFDVRPTPVLPPFEELSAASMAAGHNFFGRDPDGVMRRTPPFVIAGGRAVPSLAAAAAFAAIGVRAEDVHLTPDGRALMVGRILLPLSSKQLLINFHGAKDDKTGPPYATYSAFDILIADDELANNKTPKIDPAVFKDKVVFVGTSAAGLGDLYATPFGKSALAGAQINAAIADEVMSARPMVRASAVVNLVVLAAAALVAGVLATMLTTGWATGAVVVWMSAVGVALTIAVGQRLWIDAVAPFAGMALALFGGVAWQYFVEDREKRKMKGLFGRYVSKDVFDHLVRDPSLARLGGRRREMTVLFSDIRGFTTASEKSEPEAVVAQLNEYFTDMVDILFRHQGTLDKFVGDMVMGLFGAPLDDPKHADHAVQTAIEMVHGLARLNRKWTAEGKAPLDIGIGINSGEMIAGNIGSSAIMSYTVIGDAVNLGSRLESLNKNYSTHILISEATKNRLTIDVPTRRVDEVIVKGKTKPVVVYEVMTGGES